LALEHNLEEQAARAYRYALFYSVLVHDWRVLKSSFAKASPTVRNEESSVTAPTYVPTTHLASSNRGDWTEAARIATELMHRAEVAGVQQRITTLATLGIVRMRRGDPGVDEMLDQALALALPTHELNRIGRVTAARAEHACIDRTSSASRTKLKWDSSTWPGTQRLGSKASSSGGSRGRAPYLDSQ